MSLNISIAPSGTPVGTFFELALELGSPGSEHAPNATSPIGLAGADYFTPGPAARPEIRRIMIEREKIPAYLLRGDVTPAQCLELFDLWVALLCF
jgi:hypothetical protein